jgi:uncharacterized protein YcfL
MTNARNSRRRLALCAAAMLAVLTSCTAPKGSQNSYEGSDGSLEMKRIEGNQVLASNLSIVNPRSKRQDGRLVVQFDLKNNRSSGQRLAWAVDWFDESGFRIPDVTRRWEPVTIGGYGSTTLTIISPTTTATAWKLQVTSPDEAN